jgi:signal peptidase I
VTYVLLPAGALLAAGAAIGLLALRRGFLVTTVDGSSMEPTLRSGDRLLVRRAKRARAGQVVVFQYPDFLKAKAPAAKRPGLFLVKRAVAVPGDRLPQGWGWPDMRRIAGQVVPSGSFVVLGDNREASFDSRHDGFVHRDRLVGVVIRQLNRGADQAPLRA